MKKNTILGIILIFIIALVGYHIYDVRKCRYVQSKQCSINNVWTTDMQFKYTDTLLSTGLKRQAVESLVEYANNSFLNKTNLADIYYRAANIYMDLGEYADALRYFYAVEALLGKGSFGEEMNKQITIALENLGVSKQSQDELSLQIEVSKQPQEKGKIIARIDKREITLEDIDEALGKFPPQIKSQFDDPEQKKMFIKEFVTAEALYEKAKKIEIDKTPRIKEALDYFKKQVMVEQLIQKEIEEKFKVNPSDFESYYKANISQFAEPEGVKASFIEFKETSEKAKVLEKLKKGEGKKNALWITKEQSEIPEIGEVKEIMPKIFAKKKGEFTETLQIKDKFYIFYVEDKKEERIKPYEEVKEIVEYQYRMKTNQDIVDSFVKRVLEEEKVEIFDEMEK